MNKIIYISERWSHMSEVSGFDLLGRHLSELTAVDTIAVNQLSHWFDRAPKKMQRLVFGKKFNRRVGPSPFATRKHERIAAKLESVLASAPDALAILPLGENQISYKLFEINQSLLKRVLVIMHQPAAWHRLFWEKEEMLNLLGGIICLCEPQQEYFSSRLRVPVLGMRHGVQADFFTPGVPEEKVPKRIIFVGQWLRDFKTLRLSAERIFEVDPEVTLDCVVPRSAREHAELLKLARLGNVQWHADKNANELLDLYRKAQILFMPLIDATANNAVLEAMSAGLPVVASDVGGMRDYVDQTNAVLCRPECVEDHESAVTTLLNNPDRLMAMGEASRRLIDERLHWKTTSQRLLESIKCL